jgi:hypothetical protein
MRAQLLAYLSEALVDSIRISNELPWDEGVTPLYLKNMKRIYLDEPTVEMDQLVQILNGPDINQTRTIIRGYLTVDAKNRNADLTTAITIMANARNVETILGSFRKEFSYTTAIASDKITYTFEYRFYNLD